MLQCSSFLKKNDKLHLYVNYKSINNITIKNKYLLFLLSDTFNYFFNLVIYIKFNLYDVYH